jgi:hypothetical protein
MYVNGTITIDMMLQIHEISSNDDGNKQIDCCSADANKYHSDNSILITLRYSIQPMSDAFIGLVMHEQTPSGGLIRAVLEQKQHCKMATLISSVNFTFHDGNAFGNDFKICSGVGIACSGSHKYDTCINVIYSNCENLEQSICTIVLITSLMHTNAYQYFKGNTLFISCCIYTCAGDTKTLEWNDIIEIFIIHNSDLVGDNSETHQYSPDLHGYHGILNTESKAESASKTEAGPQGYTVIRTKIDLGVISENSPEVETFRNQQTRVDDGISLELNGWAVQHDLGVLSDEIGPAAHSTNDVQFYCNMEADMILQLDYRMENSFATYSAFDTSTTIGNANYAYHF